MLDEESLSGLLEGVDHLPLLVIPPESTDSLHRVLADEHALLREAEPLQQGVRTQRHEDILLQLRPLQVDFKDLCLEHPASPHGRSAVIHHHQHILKCLNRYYSAIEANRIQLAPSEIQNPYIFFTADCYPISSDRYALDIVSPELPSLNARSQIGLSLKDKLVGARIHEDLLPQSEHGERTIFSLEMHTF